MNKIKNFSFPIFLALLGIGIVILGAWDMQRAMASAVHDTWFPATSLPEPMAGASIQCPDQPEVIYLVGGVVGAGQTSNRLYKFDATQPYAGWIRKADLPIPLRGQAIACYQDRIYLAGGLVNAMNHLYIYSIADNAWFRGADLPDDTGGANLGAWDGKLYLLGGSRLGGLPYTPIGRVDVYDIATNTWTAGGGMNMPTPAAYAYSGVQRDQFYIITGGISGNPNNNVNKTQSYDMVNDIWHYGPVFTSARGITAGSMTASSLYVQGGDVNGGGYFDPTNLVEYLDLSGWPGGVWTDLGDPLPQASLVSAGGCTEAISGGEIWSIGGADGALFPFDDVYYRPTESCFDFYFGDLLREEMQLGNQPGEWAHYVLPVINNGTLVDSYDVSITSTWVFTSPDTIGPIAPGETGLLMVDVLVPPIVAPGDFDTAVVTITSQADMNSLDSAVLTTSVSSWQEAADVPIDIAFQQRAQCANDSNGFYVLGGSTPDLYSLNDIYYYNASADSWTYVTDLPRGGGWGHLATCYDNKLYVLGSGFTNILDVYDLVSGTWTYGLTIAPRDPFAAGIGMWDGELLMVGGTDDVDIYNIEDNIWREGPTMPVEPWGFGAVQAGQYLYVVGGFTGDWINWNDNLATTLRLNMNTEEWETGPTFTSRRGITGLGVTQSHLYAIGGDVNGGERLDTTGLVEVLDLTQWPNGEWVDIEQPLPWTLEANWGGLCTEALSGGEIWSVGGASGIWLPSGFTNILTIDDAYYLPIGEPCVQNIVNLPDEPMHGEGEIGHTITYTLPISNHGNITDYYELETTSTWFVDIVEGGDGPVAPGETIQVVIEVTVPLDVHVGDQGATIVTVYSLRDPNIMDAIPITTTVAGNEVGMTPDSLELSAFPGETIQYTLTVTNLGQIADTVNLTCTGNTWEVLLPVTSMQLDMGESSIIEVYVIIPIGATNGDMDDLVLTAISSGNPYSTAASTLTRTATWYRTLLPLALKN